MIQHSIAEIAPVVLMVIAMDVSAVQARPVTYDFTVEVTQGVLAGNTFNGSFSYDDKLITGVGTEEISVADGLSVNMIFLGQNYTETSDIDYPEFPKLVFEDGEIERLDFWIEPGERVVWWGLPGWEVELSSPDGK